MKKIILVAVLLTMFSGCVHNGNTNNTSNISTNAVINASEKPPYPYFTPWWVK